MNVQVPMDAASCEPACAHVVCRDVSHGHATCLMGCRADATLLLLRFVPGRGSKPAAELQDLHLPAPVHAHVARKSGPSALRR